MSAATLDPARDAARGGKYLTFYLGDEEYGVAILQVQEIIGVQPITRVPRTPAFVRGVINLRGKVIPIVDLRERFGMAPLDVGAAAAVAALRCIVVVEVAVRGADGVASGRRVPMGVIVDRVSEVAAVESGDVEDPPSFGAGVRTEFLLGVAMGRPADGERADPRRGSGAVADVRDGATDRAAGRVRLLLDIDRVLAADELSDVAAAGA